MSERYQYYNYLCVCGCARVCLCLPACVRACVCAHCGVPLIIWLQDLDLSLTQLLFCMQEEDGAQQKILPGPAGQGEYYHHG